MKTNSGDFIRVRADHPDVFRAGKDGMVYQDLGPCVALTFGYDRSCNPQSVVCVGPELWDKTELDFNTLTP